MEPELSVSMLLKKSANSAGVNGSFRAIVKLPNSRRLIKPSLLESKLLKIFWMVVICSEVKLFF